MPGPTEELSDVLYIVPNWDWPEPAIVTVSAHKNGLDAIAIKPTATAAAHFNNFIFMDVPSPEIHRTALQVNFSIPTADESANLFSITANGTVLRRVSGHRFTAHSHQGNFAKGDTA
jgi:hypothetical protein